MEVGLSWWIGFHAFVFFMLALDLGVINKNSHEVSVKESIIWTIIWIALAMVFNFGVYQYLGHKEAYEFLTGYVLEKSLSVDNIFIITLIFSYFKIPKLYQHRVLFWGILGALVMRIVFILAGVSLINKFHFILYIFGAFLVYSGVKMLFSHNEEKDPSESFIYKFCKKYLRMTDQLYQENFFTRRDGVLYMTPLFLVLLIIESTDLIFALDSIPATLSVTKNAFIAYTSNIFAILGLRSLYFAFAGVVGLFRFLSYALSIILIFIGGKMLLEHYIEISTSTSLVVVLGLLSASVILSMIIPEKKAE